jgi:tetratricopeptide (TPR) repeat protein
MRAASQLSKLATMSCPDKFTPEAVSGGSASRRKAPASCVCLSIVVVFGLAGCDRIGGSRHAQLIQDADTKSAQGDFTRAINLYEAALDDSESSRNADVHYKLALLYDDKLNDPVSALHHFRRYLTLNPTGAHAADVKNSIKRDEIAALTTLSGDSVITRSEAARLRNENLNLHKELEARASPARTLPDKLQERDRDGSSKKTPRKGEQAYVVQSGDTLFSISRKFYKSPTRWKDILNANKNNIHDPKKLTVGQTLVIP